MAPDLPAFLLRQPPPPPVCVYPIRILYVCVYIDRLIYIYVYINKGTRPARLPATTAPPRRYASAQSMYYMCVYT